MKTHVLNLKVFNKKICNYDKLLKKMNKNDKINHNCSKSVHLGYFSTKGRLVYEKSLENWNNRC